MLMSSVPVVLLPMGPEAGPHRACFRRQQMTYRTSLLRTALFAVVYVLATFAGRMTVMDGTNLSMVWPAAGMPMTKSVWPVRRYR